MVEIPDKIEVGPITLEPGETFYYTAWGIRYRISPGGDLRVAQIAFGKRADAEKWMNEHYKPTVAESEVVPVKRCLLLSGGNVRAWTEELVED